MTTVQGRRARAVNYDSFAAFTDAAVVAIGSDGVEFDADLTPETVTDIWWFMTSRDDADETARRTIAALLDIHTDPAVVALGNYLIGR